MTTDPAMVLPLDVLTGIFLLACRLQFADPGMLNEFFTLWAISEVSRTWRNIALSTPLLWSIITLRSLVQMNSESAKRWLSYSVECPLTLDLLLPSIFFKYDPFPALRPHLPRVRELTVARPFDIPGDSPLTSLEYLNLVWHSHNAKEGAPEGVELKRLRGLLEDAPRLRAIRVTTNFLPVFKLASTKLVELNLSLQVPVTELYEFLSACPDLTVLN
ncbi:hypothetical protein BJ138DRAFT_822334 [Hygrophoropsis aurantiaca]|uniref:Uncharacterized protein n=1 Tax=Hygrophoropsis aurantiaca TaxID=72124 RepID=A0ACB8ASE5_9AGAM|nr:hypothetical protein BJ138DRAFT_822334 [Hygrophoropsis aurantiaca]